jgi:hypothetical protein
MAAMTSRENALLVDGSLSCFEGFSPGNVPGFSPSAKINISKFQFHLVDEEPL